MCLAASGTTAEAGYSDFYATKAATLQGGGQSKGMAPDECEFMLASVLIGNTVEMDRDIEGPMSKACHDLKTPPSISSCDQTPARDGVDQCTSPPGMATRLGELKYNTVRGYTQTQISPQISGQPGWIMNPDCPRSRVWIVYENGRACASQSVTLVRICMAGYLDILSLWYCNTMHSALTIV